MCQRNETTTRSSAPNEDLITEIVNIAMEGGCAPTVCNSSPTYMRGAGRIDVSLLLATFDPDRLIKANLDNTFCVRSDYKYGRRLKPDLSLSPAERHAHIKDKFRSGWTIASDGTERVSQNVLALCQKFSERFGYICRANLYVTPPDTRGFPPHFDSHDVFVVHLLGQKTWTIENSRRGLPHRRAISPPDLAIADDATTHVMEPGDILFIPKGHPHVVDNASRSNGAQLTLACTSPHLEDILLQCISNALEATEIFNRNFPAYTQEGDLAEAARALSLLAERLKNANIADAVSQVREHHLRQMDRHAHDSLFQR